MKNKQTGNYFEVLTAKILVSKGAHIVDQNVYGSFSEIDLITRHQQSIFFIEIKFRSQDYFEFYEHYLTSQYPKFKKQVMQYLAGQPQLHDAVFQMYLFLYSKNFQKGLNLKCYKLPECEIFVR